jgi:hypothetical protein
MKMKGKGQISSAAAALNNAEMGILTEEKADENKKLLSISSDQLYVGDDARTVINEDEAAAITMAKEAAKKFTKQHPETQTFAKTAVKVRNATSNA